MATIQPFKKTYLTNNKKTPVDILLNSIWELSYYICIRLGNTIIVGFKVQKLPGDIAEVVDNWLSLVLVVMCYKFSIIPLGICVGFTCLCLEAYKRTSACTLHVLHQLMHTLTTFVSLSGFMTDILICFVINTKYWLKCVFFQCIMVFGFVMHKPLELDNYVYPDWANAIGWCVAASSIICLPGVAIFKILTTSGSFREVNTSLA